MVQIDKVATVTKNWVESVVISMNLCPFAKAELVKDRVRFAVTTTTTPTKLLEDLKEELQRLNTHPNIETTLLIHPETLQDFYQYNAFLDEADRLLVDMELEGTYQIASFHPDYLFGGTEPNDAENYTNRSPYPMLHILREESLERAIANYPNVEKIPERNISLMNEIGYIKLQMLLKSSLV